jgi:hypothetical protein
VVVLIVALAADAMVIGGDGLLITFAALRDCGAGLLVLSGALLVVLWALTGRAAHAYEGSALVLVGGGLLTLGGPWAAWLHGHEIIALLGPGTRLAVGLPALLLLFRAVSLGPVDSSVRPFPALTNATMVTLALLGIEAVTRIAGPIDNRLGWQIGFGILAVGWSVVGGQRLIWPDPRGTPRCEQVIGAAMVAWGIGDVGLLLAAQWGLRWGVASAAVQLVGAALLAWASVTMLVTALSRDSIRRLTLAGELGDVSSMLADEQSLRQVLLHDASNVVAAIRAANLTLERHSERLDPAVQTQLREAMGTEVSKLQSLLDPATLASSRMRS